jgi:hypothetical protein
LRAKLLALLEESPGFRQLTEDSASKIKNRLNGILANLNEKALKEISDNLKRFRVFETREALIHAAPPSVTPEASGYYDCDKNEVNIYATGYYAPNTLAHELGHAIDGPNHRYSGSDGWIAAWEAEIRPGDPGRIARRQKAMEKYAREKCGVPFEKLAPEQITKALEATGAEAFWLEDYARKSASEGFAEFMYRYMAGTKAERKLLSEKYPRAWKYLLGEGIISDNQ